MILASISHRCDIDSVEALADAIGLTIGEISEALYGRPTVRRKCCRRMLAACIDDAILARCSTAIVQMLNGDIESLYV